MKREKKRLVKAGMTAALFLAAVICYTVRGGAGAETVKLGEREEAVIPGLWAEEPGAQEEEEKTAEPGDTIPGERMEAADSENAAPSVQGKAAATRVQEEPALPEVQEEAAAAATLFVHVCGEVISPGVYELPEGSRVFEAVEAAGGLTEKGDGTFLNLAAELADGVQVRIPSLEEARTLRESGIDPGAAGFFGAGQTAETARQTAAAEQRDGRVNLNTASKEELMTLSGIGEARAEAILAYRESAGPFQKIEDIMKVSGIKEAAFQKIKDDISV